MHKVGATAGCRVLRLPFGVTHGTFPSCRPVSDPELLEN